MADEVVIITDYVKDGQPINGRFPITVKGYLNCPLKGQLETDQILLKQRLHILSEEPDEINEIGDHYMVSIKDKDTQYVSVDGSDDVYLYLS